MIATLNFEATASFHIIFSVRAKTMVGHGFPLSIEDHRTRLYSTHHALFLILESSKFKKARSISEVKLLALLENKTQLTDFVITESFFFLFISLFVLLLIPFCFCLVIMKVLKLSNIHFHQFFRPAPQNALILFCP